MEYNIINQEVIHSMRSSKLKKGWMAIKVDLEKTFDRLHWNFIADSLLDLGFWIPPGIHLIIIIGSIASSSFQVQWNGFLTRTFYPERGIRRDDPLSSYLFILAMECLGHLINHSISNASWDLFRFVKNSVPLIHLFFADDLILYARVDMSQARIIKDVLTAFGSSSRHRVHDFNAAFILKIDFSLLTDIRALWINLLSQKYKMVGPCPKSISRPNCTPLWRALSTYRNELKFSIAWSLGDDNSVRPLDDVSGAITWPFK
ncbi:uncharacterized protein LOC120121112 [Hibiscus syriacus]|uniref:uncharacterized protein LOC120121112 n=1 Tax=Hibiscus syriacus TaxID=106335 RepID=UPI001922F49B|nr:uncharacterized protein LOC120121112 [Hibiscus syriacus]